MNNTTQAMITQCANSLLVTQAYNIYSSKFAPSAIIIHTYTILEQISQWEKGDGATICWLAYYDYFLFCQILQAALYKRCYPPTKSHFTCTLLYTLSVHARVFHKTKSTSRAFIRLSARSKPYNFSCLIFASPKFHLVCKRFLYDFFGLISSFIELLHCTLPSCCFLFLFLLSSAYTVRVASLVVCTMNQCVTPRLTQHAIKETSQMQKQAALLFYVCTLC